jgi:hypothetical protein
MLITFIKELHEARMIRTVGDLNISFSEVCENLYLVLLTLEFLTRSAKGRKLADTYARQTASYINYKEFRPSATDLYNLIYFVEETPEQVEKIFKSEDAKKLRQITTIPRMELNRWLLKVGDETTKDYYFFMRLEQALNVKSADLKEIRRLLSLRNPSSSDNRNLALRILNVYRFKMPLLDIRQEIEDILSP